MAKIKWLKHPTSPELNNSTQHVRRNVAEYAVAVGQASPCPKPAYGTAEWAADRQALDAQRVIPEGERNQITGTEWGVQDRAVSPQSCVLVIKRTAYETLYYDAADLPSDVPESVRQRAITLLATENLMAADAAAIEKVKKKAAEYEEATKASKCAVLFGKK